MDAVKAKLQLQKYPAYKDSGVEWFGQIPNHWEVKRLGSLLSPISEKKRPELPLLSITREKGVIERNVDDEDENHNYIPDDLSGYKVLRKGQFGMNKMKAWQGSYGISKYTGIVSPAYYVFDFNYDVDPDFFNIAIRSKKYVSFFGSASDGVRIGQWDLSKNRMKQIPFILPLIHEQTAIANFLDDKCGKIDTAIAQKQQLIELLKERRQIVIQEVVTGKKVWNAAKNAWTEPVEVKDSGVEWIGEIPAHWEVKKMTYVCKIDTGATPDRSNGSYWNGDIPWIKTGEVNYDIIYSTEEFITEKGLKNSATRLAPKGTLLMAMYGQGITRGRVSLLGVEAAYNQACCAMLFNEEIFNRYAFHFFVMAYSYIRDGGNETSQMNISAGYISNLKILQPPLSEQKEIANYIENASQKIDKAIDFQQQQIEKLKEYKGSLIDAAVTGKIKV